MFILSEKKYSGFTLLELSIVLFIVTLLLGGLLVPFSASVEQRNRSDTEKALQEIKEALYGFAVVNGRLPCPDCEAASTSCPSGTPDDGIEDLDGDNCSIQVGNLPWATLNVPQFDAWENTFTYRVTAEYSRGVYIDDAPLTPSCTSTGAVFDLCALGDMNISKTVNGTANVAQNIPAIVISHGKNRYSSIQTAEEMENYKRNPRKFGTTNPPIMPAYNNVSANTFVYNNYTLADGEVSFDDLMIWISPFVLKNRLINAGKLP